MEDPSKGIDASVGGLVWVRRRNGSWWPGRIVGHEELPEGGVPTPKAGTPVKLLGRHDASVDWYNLERSKRVKPFRCGEYDDCIEKAKASAHASHHSKKSVKYARREEAILEALELESARLGKDFPNLYTEPNTLDGEQHHVDETPSLNFNEESVDIDKDLRSSADESDSAPKISHSGVPFDEANHVDAIMEEPNWRRTPNDSEDDGIEGAKRMRGLEDLGLGVTSSLKRKRSQVAHTQDCLKRKSRRRALTRVLECTAAVPDPEKLSSPIELSVPGASESKVSELGSNESKVNNSLVINNSDSTGVSCENLTSLNTSHHSSDPSLKTEPRENEISSIQEGPGCEYPESLLDFPLPDEEKDSAGLSTIISGVPQKSIVGARAQSSQSSHVETVSLGNEEHNESGSTSSGTADFCDMGQRMDKGPSRWQLKGKRNSRLRKMDIDDEAEMCRSGTDGDRSLGSNQLGGSLMYAGGTCLKSNAITDSQIEEIRGWNWNGPQRQSRASRPTTELATPQRQLPYRQSRFTVNPKYDAFDFSVKHHTSVSNSGLYDVPVEVRTNHRAQQVPFISLMSRLTDRPIIGHPVSVEVLDDGASSDLLSFSEGHSSTSELNYNAINMSATHTANTGNRQKSRGRPPRKHHRSGRSHSKSSPKLKNGIPSKKIRRLSSLTNLRGHEETKPFVEKTSGPSLACVPLKVVFSRINAALNS